MTVLLAASMLAALLTGCEKAETLNTSGDGTESAAADAADTADTQATSDVQAVALSSGKLYTIMADGSVAEHAMRLPQDARAEGACLADGDILICYVEEDPVDYSNSNYAVAKVSEDGSVNEIFSKKEDISSGTLTAAGDKAYYCYNYYDLESNSHEVVLEYDRSQGTLVEAPDMTEHADADELDNYYNAGYGLTPDIEIAKYGYMPMVDFDNSQINLMDLEGNAQYTLPVDGANFLDLIGDDLYYYTYAGEETVDPVYEIRVCNITNDENRVIYMAQTGNGAFRTDIPGVEGFTVVGDNAYFVLEDETSDEWYKITLLDGDAEPEKCGLAVNEYECFDLGSIESGSREFRTENTDCIYYSYHIEKFVVDSSVNNADGINAKLDEIFANNVKEAEDDAASNAEYYVEDDGIPASSTEVKLSDAKLLGDKYLQVEYSGYVYSGGAHGTPYHLIYDFDTETGDEVTIKDLYTGTEEEFNEIAMNAVLAQIHADNGQGQFYPEYYEMTDEELRETIADYVNIDTVGFFTEDAYVLEFDPYLLGAYASGFITVEIPLEDLGITF